jgi:hypothetical protein
LPSKFVKRFRIRRKFFFLLQNFMLISIPLQKKTQKKKVINEKVTEKLSFFTL